MLKGIILLSDEQRPVAGAAVHLLDNRSFLCFNRCVIHKQAAGSEPPPISQ